MRVKSYYSRAVEDAMAAARQELGPEAMLINSRKSPPEARHLGEYEVVFATELSAVTDDPVGSQSDSGAGDRLASEVSDLKKELEGMRRALQRGAFSGVPWNAASPNYSEAQTALAASDLEAGFAREVLQAAEARAAAATAPTAGTRAAPARPAQDLFRRALIEELESRFSVEPSLGRGESRPRILAVIGPPGCGKTTTLVKLAVNYGLTSRRPVLLLSIDTYRVAAAEQLRCYAAILGIGFHVVETVSALAQVIEENRGKELIFIDTPGMGSTEADVAPGLSQFLSTRNDIDTQLALSASMKSADLSRVVDHFEIFRPQRLVFTRLDETTSYGPILYEAARTGKPLSFFSTGQRIPEDLETANKARVIELVLTGRNRQASSAA